MSKRKSKILPKQLLFLLESKGDVNRALKSLLDSEFERIRKTWLYSENLLPAVRKFVERDGKRIRPSLAILIYKAFSGTKDSQIITASLSTELMHDSFIIHDDLYDHIPGQLGTRRGGKVLHLTYEEDFLKKNAGKDSNWHPETFAKHATVASAHLLLSIGARTIYQSHFPESLKARALAAYWNTIEETWIGQGMDILSKGKVVSEVSKGEILSIELSRAGVYTVEFPLHLGAILAGKDSKILRAISAYARPVGLAFEIYDDVLGMFGEEAEIGKIQADLAEGKRTLLIQRALVSGTDKQRSELISLLKQRSPSKKQVRKAREIIVKTDALAYTTHLTDKLIEKAQNALKKIDIPNNIKEKLSAFAEFVINRRK